MGRKSGKSRQGRRQDGKKMDSAKLAQKVLDFLDNRFNEGYSEKQLIKKLELRDAFSKESLSVVLQKLKEAGSITKNSRNEYFSNSEPAYVLGYVDYVNPRFAFVIPKDQEKSDNDILVKENDLLNALDGDLVKVMIYPKKAKNGRQEGRVVEVVERDRDEFVGRVEISPRFAFVVP